MKQKKKWKFILFIIVIILFFIWISDDESEDTSTDVDSNIAYNYSEDQIYRYNRNLNEVNFNDVDFNPWSVFEASKSLEVQNYKPYTIMIYMNGSDLESEDGSATDDISEIIDSGVDTNNVNLIVLTGGTEEWQRYGIPSDECVIWRIENGNLNYLTSIGQRNMGDAGTLSSFIDYGLGNFPSDKYGLIFWNHGSGAIDGFGMDENFDDDNLNLIEMNYAFQNSAANTKKLEFIGFDACLMASLETAAVTSNYAKYLVASEDLEPGSGWRYTFLEKLNDDPNITGDKLGKAIVDEYVSWNDFILFDDVTLSVTDLSNIDILLGAMDKIMAKCYNDLSNDSNYEYFRSFSTIRDGTRTFGRGSPRDNYYDMIDIGDFGDKLSDLYPEEVNYLKYALQKTVIYNKYTTYTKDIHGLTSFYLYGGKDYADDSINFYNKLNMGKNYTNYLSKFAEILTGDSICKINMKNKSIKENSEGEYSITLTKDELENSTNIYFTLWEPVLDEEDYYFLIGLNSKVDISKNRKITTEFNGVWPGVNGEFVCLYEIEKNGDEVKYSIPAELNGVDVDIIAVYNKEYPDGKIIGARTLTDENSKMASKGLTEIKNGDKVAFCYNAQYFGDDESKEQNEWYIGEEIIVNDEFKLDWYEVNDGDVYLYSFLLRDVQQNEHYTDFVEVTFSEE